MAFQIFAVHNAILIGILLFGAGLWMYFGNRTRPRNITMSALLVVTAFWSFSHVLWRASTDSSQIEFWLKILLFISLLLPAFLLYYNLTLLKEKMPSFIVQSAVILPSIVSLWLIFGTKLVVQVQADGTAKFGIGALLLALYFGAAFLSGLLILLFVSRKNKNIKQLILVCAFGGSILAFNTVFSVLTGAASYHDLRSFWLANAALAIGVIIMAVPVIGKQVVSDLRLVGGELFILLVITLIVTDVVISETLLDFSFKLVLLVIIVFYGVIILRSLVREVHRLKQVEKLNKKIEKVNRELMEVDKMKTRFLSFASHQMRSPLSGVLSYMSMLKDGDFGKMSKKQVDIMGMSIDAMGRLRDTIETFLDVSKIEMGGLDLKRVPTDLGLLCAEVVTEQTVVANKKGVKLQLSVAKNTPVIMADSGKLYHAIINLVDNAIKYTEQGFIKIEVKSTNGLVKIIVSDTGQGMQRKEVQRIRRVMEHGLEVIKFEKEGGSGLGIHIANKIVEGHGGNIVVSSAGIGKGTTFTICLPKGEE